MRRLSWGAGAVLVLLSGEGAQHAAPAQELGMPGLPEGVWEWPLLAGLLVVVGWVLWTQREERRRMAEEMAGERARYEERVGRLLDAAELDRQRQIEAWNGLVQRSIETQASVAEGLGRLCLEVDRLTRAMSEEHEEIMARCVEGHAGATTGVDSRQRPAGMTGRDG